MVEKEALPVVSPEEMLQVLQHEDCETARSLHELGKTLNCKISAKAGAKSYKIVHSVTGANKRALFTIECNSKGWRVKANLFRINAYEDAVQQSSARIRDAIKATRACVKCNPGCKGRSSYTIDGTTYLPCFGSGHYFSKLEAADWEQLERLIALEASF